MSAISRSGASRIRRRLCFRRSSVTVCEKLFSGRFEQHVKVAHGDAEQVRHHRRREVRPVQVVRDQAPRQRQARGPQRVPVQAGCRAA